MKRVLLVADEIAAGSLVEHTSPVASLEPDRKVGEREPLAATEELERVRALGTRRGISPHNGESGS